MTQGHVLITGASEGMGREFARIFAKEGYSLVLVARDRVRLTEIADELSAAYGTKVQTIPKDLSVSTAADELKAELDQQGITIEILINNAGSGIHGFFHEADLKATEAMLALNMVTPTSLTRLFLTSMVRNGHGKILNVSSTAAFQPGPLMACYFASKAYVLSFTEALANELSGSGVTITAFCPGPTRTQFQKRAKTEDIRENAFSMDAVTAVRMAYEGLMKGKKFIVPGFFNKLLALMVRLSLKSVVIRVTRYLEEKKKK